MDNPENVELNINVLEVARYLGYKGAGPEPDIEALIRDCTDEVVAKSELRSVCTRLPVNWQKPGEPPFSVGGIEVKSHDLAKNLTGCNEAFLFGATIGIGLDRLIKRESSRDITKAAVYQAAGAAYIEAYCDHINAELKSAAAAEGRKTKPRFSPGFGDFTIEYQKEIFRELDLTKKTGASLTEGMLMIPSKTVTAIVGIY